MGFLGMTTIPGHAHVHTVRHSQRLSYSMTKPRKSRQLERLVGMMPPLQRLKDCLRLLILKTAPTLMKEDSMNVGTSRLVHLLVLMKLLPFTSFITTSWWMGECPGGNPDQLDDRILPTSLVLT
jgi:hypothetical protein